MCGIFGYVGKSHKAAQIVLEGLKTLEYRGYDSWGITVKQDTTLFVDKHVGKIGDATTQLPPSTIGIGHTRWATHGGVTKKNAHPHLDCTRQVAVIHNGIVENFKELKEELLAKDHSFFSETDSEVIVHLIEEFQKSYDFSRSVREAFTRLKGMNAIVVVNAVSSEIIAAKNGSPLIIGIGDDAFFIASDAAGIIQHTRDLLFVKDKEMAILGKKLQLLKLPSGEKISPHIEHITWAIENVDKGAFDHFMLKEIHEEMIVVRKIAETYEDEIKSISDVIGNAQGTFFIGCGTAYHACLTGEYLFSKIARKHVNTAVASEFNYLEDFLHERSLIIALSQSGETIDIVEPVTKAKEKGAKLIGITNTLGSTIYRMSDFKLLLGAGPEKAVASTKAYVAKLAVLILLSYRLAGKSKEGKQILLDAADEIERQIKDSTPIVKKLAKQLAQKEHMYVIGRGMSYAAALEAALKIKEVSYLHTEGLAGGELKHGTIALISQGTPCIVFAPLDDTHDAIISNAIEIKSRGGLIIGVSPKPSEVFDVYISVVDGGIGSVITQAIPMQLLAYYLALEKGLDPDKPRNLAKSVTVK